VTINPTAHADAILSWLENEIGAVSRDELRKRIEDEVRDVARRAYEDAASVLASAGDKVQRYGGNSHYVRATQDAQEALLLLARDAIAH
jgi:hypothetical protein